MWRYLVIFSLLLFQISLDIAFQKFCVSFWVKNDFYNVKKIVNLIRIWYVCVINLEHWFYIVAVYIFFTLCFSACYKYYILRNFFFMRHDSEKKKICLIFLFGFKIFKYNNNRHGIVFHWIVSINEHFCP